MEAETRSKFMALADRLAAAWDAEREADAMGENISTGAGSTRAQRDFARRYSETGLHNQIVSIRPETLEEALIALAVMADNAVLLAFKADTTIRAMAEAMSETIALAEAAGINVHPACRAHYVRRVQEA